MPTLDSTRLRALMRRELGRAGVCDASTDHVVQSLVETSLRGTDSHGVALFPHYLRAVGSGRISKQPCIKVEEQRGGVARVNADHAFGQHAGSFAMALAQELAAASGISAVSVSDSTHFGAAGYFALQAARKGYAAFSFTNADALIRMADGVAPYFGTNPICFAAPLANEDPFCLDMATSTVSWNQVGNHARTGTALEPGWADDANGEPTCDASAAAMLEGLGGYKGFGLSMMVELLCGMLSGGPVGRELLPMYRSPIEARRQISHFFVAIDLDYFVGRDGFARRLQAIVEDIRTQPPRDGEADAPVMVPGDPEKHSVARRLREGIPMDDEKFAEYCAISADFAEAVL
jgi:ureidoglycolate dehydrogenase (NAD+)